jgi:hypothetical protein
MGPGPTKEGTGPKESWARRHVGGWEGAAGGELVWDTFFCGGEAVVEEGVVRR